MSDQLFMAMMASFNELKDIKSLFDLIGIAVSLLGLAIGTVLIWRMKHRYLQEVYMLTFLSDSMIAKHKQVQSFLAAISKGTPND
jgi:type III secretory pathway component EscU